MATTRLAPSTTISRSGCPAARSAPITARSRGSAARSYTTTDLHQTWERTCRLTATAEIAASRRAKIATVTTMVSTAARETRIMITATTAERGQLTTRTTRRGIEKNRQRDLHAPSTSLTYYPYKLFSTTRTFTYTLHAVLRPRPCRSGSHRRRRARERSSRHRPAQSRRAARRGARPREARTHHLPDGRSGGGARRRRPTPE